jgi:hypothetical protein
MSAPRLAVGVARARATSTIETTTTTTTTTRAAAAAARRRAATATSAARAGRITSPSSLRRSRAAIVASAKRDADDEKDVVATKEKEKEKEEREKVNLAEEFKAGMNFGNAIKARFTSARIDDRGLPIADALVVTTVPVFVSIVVLALGVPRPSWLVPAPWVPRWRSLPLLVPALSHGAKLAACWIPGALAARAYEREAYDGTVEEAVRRVHVYAGPRTTALARCTPLLKD